VLLAMEEAVIHGMIEKLTKKQPENVEYFNFFL
jgi:hypothetical protein